MFGHYHPTQVRWWSPYIGSREAMLCEQSELPVYKAHAFNNFEDIMQGISVI